MRMTAAGIRPAGRGQLLFLLQPAQLDGLDHVPRRGGEEGERREQGPAHNGGGREEAGPAVGGEAVGERLQPRVNAVAEGSVEEAPPALAVCVLRRAYVRCRCFGVFGGRGLLSIRRASEGLEDLALVHLALL